MICEICTRVQSLIIIFAKFMILFKEPKRIFICIAKYHSLSNALCKPGDLVEFNYFSNTYLGVVTKESEPGEKIEALFTDGKIYPRSRSTLCFHCGKYQDPSSLHKIDHVLGKLYTLEQSSSSILKKNIKKLKSIITENDLSVNQTWTPTTLAFKLLGYNIKSLPTEVLHACHRFLYFDTLHFSRISQLSGIYYCQHSRSHVEWMYKIIKTFSSDGNQDSYKNNPHILRFRKLLTCLISPKSTDIPSNELHSLLKNDPHLSLLLSAVVYYSISTGSNRFNHPFEKLVLQCINGVVPYEFTFDIYQTLYTHGFVSQGFDPSLLRSYLYCVSKPYEHSNSIPEKEDYTTASLNPCYGSEMSPQVEHSYTKSLESITIDKAYRKQTSSIDQISERHDWGNMTAYAIDDPETCEVDDALSFEVDHKGQEWIYVHIADPTSHIDLHSILSKDYCSRLGTSIYLPHTRIYMIPPKLGKEISLDNTDINDGYHYVVTHKFRIDENGDIRDGSVILGVIRHVKRMSYEQIDHILSKENHQEPSLSNKYIQDPKYIFHKLLNMAKSHLRYRKSLGAIQIANPKPVIKLNHEKTKVASILNEYDWAASPARLIVSECMILCNRMVAQWCKERNIPIPYRIQDSCALGALSLFEKLNKSYPFQNINTSHNNTTINPEYLATVRECLPMLQRSSHLSKDFPHWMLGLPLYTRATSPMRRYTDFIVQHQMKAYISGGKLLENNRSFHFLLVRLDDILYRARVLQRQSTLYWLYKHVHDQPTRPYQGIVIQSNRYTNDHRFIDTDTMPDATHSKPSDRFLHVYVHELCHGFNVPVKDQREYNIGDSINLVPKNVSLARPAIYWEAHQS